MAAVALRQATHEGVFSARSRRADVVAVSHKRAQAVADVLCGRRGFTQVAPLLESTVADQLKRRVAMALRLRSSTKMAIMPERVKSVHVCEPAKGALEVSFTMVSVKTVKACAMRLEQKRGRWMIAHLDIL